MTEKLKEALIKAAEEEDWSVSVDGDCWEFEKYSPAGEDFICCVTGDDIVSEVDDYHENFDTEDHVMMHMEAKKHGLSGVPSLKILVEDADAIDDMLCELYYALKKAEDAYYDELDEEDEEDDDE